MSKVKCLYCGKELDTDKDAWEKPRTNRYAHLECCTEDNDNYMCDKIKGYARKQLGELYNPVRVNSQLKRYREKLYFSPKKIYQALTYWYEVQGASPEKSNGGIGIVESVWQEAEQYYIAKQYRLEQAKQYNIKDYVEAPVKATVKWEPPVRPKNYEIIDLQ